MWLLYAMHSLSLFLHVLLMSGICLNDWNWNLQKDKISIDCNRNVDLKVTEFTLIMLMNLAQRVVSKAHITTCSAEDQLLLWAWFLFRGSSLVKRLLLMDNLKFKAKFAVECLSHIATESITNRNIPQNSKVGINNDQCLLQVYELPMTHSQVLQI